MKPPHVPPQHPPIEPRARRLSPWWRGAVIGLAVFVALIVALAVVPWAEIG